jgi:hypothetical protein
MILSSDCGEKSIDFAHLDSIKVRNHTGLFVSYGTVALRTASNRRKGKSFNIEFAANVAMHSFIHYSNG